MKRVSGFFSSPKKVLLGIILIAVLLRVIFAILLGNEVVNLPGISDQISYHTLALRVLDGYGFSFGEPWWPATDANEPTAHWSYLYTLYLTAVYALFGRNPLAARLVQAIISGIVMPWLVYKLSIHTFDCQRQNGDVGLARGEKIGLVAATLVAIYIYFVYYAAALITESFYIVAVLGVFVLALQIVETAGAGWRQWLLLGLALGAAVLLRQLFLLFVPFLLLWLWWVTRPRLSYLAVSVALIVAMIFPWTMRNFQAFDQFVLLNTNAGYAFYWGNHPTYGTDFIPILPSEAYYELLPQDLLAQDLNEAALESALLERGLGFVFNDPERYVLLSLSRIPHYFVFWPSPDSGTISNISRVASFGLFLPFMVYGLFLSFQTVPRSLKAVIRSPLFILYFFIIFYTGLHVLTWTLIRYRLPLDALFIVFAGLAILKLVERVQIRRRPSSVPTEVKS